VTGLPQGPFGILATPRGNDPHPTASQGFRVEYNLTVDLGIEKTFFVSGRRLMVRVDVFNLLNQDKNTLENDLSGDNFHTRVPLGTQAPRVFRAGLRYEF
jgi:outer membrane receptor protein involved in Fe transport